MNTDVGLPSSGASIPPLKQILSPLVVRMAIQTTLEKVVLRSLRVPDPASKSRDLVDLASRVGSWKESELRPFESLAHSSIAYPNFKDALADNLHKRTELVASQLLEIWPPCSTGKLCDYGCGDGKHGRALQKSTSLEIFYADVSRHPALNGTEFRFDVISEETPWNVYEDDFFDHVMAGCVGHHTRCPETFLANVARITRKGGMIALTESVFDVNNRVLLSEKSPKKESLVKAEATFKSLSKDYQLGWLVFFDYFYNRVIHFTEDKVRKIPMGLSYGTPESWIEKAGRVGLNHVSTHVHGIDRSLVPVYHVTHLFNG